jgi:hypothetical protein
MKTVYTYGHPKPELISPDNWNMDLHYLDRPNARRGQLDFFTTTAPTSDFIRSGRRSSGRSNRRRSFSGVDMFFTREGGECYLKELPKSRCTD